MCSLDSRRWMSAPISNNAANSIDSISNLLIDVKLRLAEWVFSKSNIAVSRLTGLNNLGIAAVLIFLWSWKSRETVPIYATCHWARHVILDFFFFECKLTNHSKISTIDRPAVKTLRSSRKWAILLSSWRTSFQCRGKVNQKSISCNGNTCEWIKYCFVTQNKGLQLYVTDDNSFPSICDRARGEVFDQNYWFGSIKSWQHWSNVSAYFCWSKDAHSLFFSDEVSAIIIDWTDNTFYAITSIIWKYEEKQAECT